MLVPGLLLRVAGTVINSAISALNKTLTLNPSLRRLVLPSVPPGSAYHRSWSGLKLILLAEVCKLRLLATIGYTIHTIMLKCMLESQGNQTILFVPAVAASITVIPARNQISFKKLPQFKDFWVLSRSKSSEDSSGRLK